ncbi:MAG: DUF2341 domain-containing protein [Candidatus Paceibacterota bacterium]
MKSMQFSRAFTLIELLVTIAIVGILAGFIFISMTDSLNSANDARRKSDLSAIQKALLMYQSAGHTYPVLSSCTIGAAGCLGDPSNNVLSDYLARMPTDPQSPTKNYTYASTSGADFTIQATLNSGASYSFSTANGWSTGVAGYGHYKIITIASGTSLTNYPIKLIVYKAANQGANGTANCEGLCVDAFTDVAFSDSAGNTALPFWIETGSVVSGTSATFWVNVPAIANGNTTIRMYYQSASPTLSSNGSLTFSSSQGMFFDDYINPVSSLDSSKWTLLGAATVTVSNSIMSHIGTGAISELYSSYYVPDNYILETYAKSYHANTSYREQFVYSDRVGHGYYVAPSPYDLGLSTPMYRVWNNGSWGSALAMGGWTANVWHRITLKRHGQFDCYIDNANLVTATPYFAANGTWSTYVQNAGSRVDIDWVLVRPYVASEPTATFGTQN